MLVSIVIRTYNEERYLPEVLLAVSEQTVPADQREVILVDSGSKDRTLEIAKHYGCRIVHIKQSEFSFGRSLNVGCEAARGRYLVFISGHCVPTQNTWLANLLAPLEAKAAGISFGRQEGGPETKFSEHQLFAKYFPAGDLPPPTEFFCNNANAAVRHDLWDRIRFDETLTGLEDMHFARRAVGEGEKVRYVPISIVYHYHHESWQKVKIRYEREAIALQRIMPEVQVHATDALRYFVAGVFGDWARAISQKRFLKSALEIICFRFCQYHGTWKGNHIHRQLSRKSKEKYFYPR
jgi:rhamnosyltransferase